MPLDLCGTRFDESSDFLLALVLASCCFHPEGLDYVTVGVPAYRIINMVRLGFSKHSPETLGCAGSNN